MSLIFDSINEILVWFGFEVAKLLSLIKICSNKNRIPPSPQFSSNNFHLKKLRTLCQRWNSFQFECNEMLSIQILSTKRWMMSKYPSNVNIFCIPTQSAHSFTFKLCFLLYGNKNNNDNERNSYIKSALCSLIQLIRAYLWSKSEIKIALLRVLCTIFMIYVCADGRHNICLPAFDAIFQHY